MRWKFGQMKIISIVGRQTVYTSNVYMVMGEWKRIEDMNTLVDVGNDPSIIEVIAHTNGGVGKKKVDQVVLTHTHSDHSGILPLIKAAFHPKIFAFSPFMDGVDHILKHGDTLRMGDSDFEVIHTPGHSGDSICLYNKDRGLLFAGDTPLLIRSVGGAYEDGFYRSLVQLCKKNIKTIYFGHGDPVTRNVHDMLRASLENVRSSMNH